VTIPPFRTVQQAVTSVKLLQDNCKRVFDAVVAVALLGGQLVSRQALSATASTAVSHKLGRVPRGWIVVRNSANAVVYEYTPAAGQPAALNSQTLVLQASAATTVDLWIF